MAKYIPSKEILGLQKELFRIQEIVDRLESRCDPGLDFSRPLTDFEKTLVQDYYERERAELARIKKQDEDLWNLIFK